MWGVAGDLTLFIESDTCFLFPFPLNLEGPRIASLKAVLYLSEDVY